MLFASARAAMESVVRVLLSILAVLLLVPGWTVEERLPLPSPGYRLSAERVALDPGDPARRRLGGLVYLGGVALSSGDPAFGGFSALAVEGDRFMTVSDGGNLLRFRMGADWRVRDATYSPLPAGPGTGWEKRERDTEALARDPAGGRFWVAFERANQIWRFGPGGRVARVAPPAMRRWRQNGGAESMARLPDGGFVVLAESGGEALRFAGDPVAGAPAFRFRYRPATGMKPVDAAALPDGRLLVLERRFRAPYRWDSRLAVVAAGAVRPGARVRGRALARWAEPLLSDNFEGIAVTREGNATVLWMVSDDNQSMLQRTLLLKFRLDA